MNEDLGNRIKSVRQQRSLTQEEAAAELGIHPRSIQDYERGQAEPRPGARRRRILAWLEQHEAAAA